jgi:hypothetical protein
MKTHFLFFIALLLLESTVGLGQSTSAPSAQLDPTMKNFLNSEIMTRFRDLRIEAENSVAAFKLDLNKFSPDDIQRVRVGYEKTADRFNQEIVNIKNDFLNKKKLKYITDFPDDYTGNLELRFRELSRFYSENFVQVLQEVQKNQEDGVIVLTILMELAKFAPQVIEHFREMKAVSAKFNEEYLEKHFTGPLKFPGWFDIQVEQGYINPQVTNPESTNFRETGPGPVQADSSATKGQQWWESNSTLPLDSKNIDGTGKSDPPNSKQSGRTSPPPNPFAHPSDTLKTKPNTLPIKKNS